MDIKGFIEILNKYSGPRSYYIFEAFVLELLKKHLDVQSKPFYPHYKSSNKREYDGLAPDGIDDLPGPTLIEVKLYKNSDIAIRHVMRNFMMDNDIKSILLIIGKNLASEERSRILKSFPVSSIKIKIWDLSDLAKIADPYPQSAFSFISELSQSILRETVAYGSKRSPDEWKEKKAEHISKLKESCKNHGIVLFLGSGISKDAGIPVWNDLIYNLFCCLNSRKIRR